MAQQVGPLFYTGSMGGTTGYKRNGKYFVKTKNMITRDTVLHSPRFVRTRENAKEWRRAVRAGMLVRHSLRHLIKNLQLADTPISGRLSAWMNRIVKSDPVSDRGARRITNGQLELLEDFAFRKGATFSSVCAAGPVSSIDTATGRMKIELRSFDPRQRIQLPEEVRATHFKIVLNGAAIDFEREQFQCGYQETDYLSMEEVTAPICLEQLLAPTPGQALLVAIGVVFYVQGEGGRYERVSGGGMRVLQVSEPGFGEIERIRRKEVTADTEAIAGVEVEGYSVEGLADEIVESEAKGVMGCFGKKYDDQAIQYSNLLPEVNFGEEEQEPAMELINTS
ncbi:hypothetical protein HB364_24150 [Pseudoflavitalea sp. X16]|uniref:hypothetical protein n=1 Tax=Paraflavitalea devenefica TaxID=2716334 RepID=UPI001423D9D6|nr:hypothetical protein [Paraflavitalea devenefica]NII28197.1 hypothetical protein [Paraflavitalea devenefica]